MWSKSEGKRLCEVVRLSTGGREGRRDYACDDNFTLDLCDGYPGLLTTFAMRF